MLAIKLSLDGLKSFQTIILEAASLRAGIFLDEFLDGKS
jgi:hypothetical protein